MSQKSTKTTQSSSLEAKEQEERKNASFFFELFAEDHMMDAADVINGVYGMMLNPTRGLVNSLGGSDERGKTFYTFDEFWKIYQDVKGANLNEGGYYEFVECLKVYDLAETGMMKLMDLEHMLLSLGERITQEELDSILDDCMLEEEDDDGCFPYIPFLCRLCERPLPSAPKKEVPPPKKKR